MLPSYEEALREGVTPATNNGASSNRRSLDHGHVTYRHHNNAHRYNQ